MANPIRERRMAAGLSQVKLGLQARVPHTAISDFELYKRQPWPAARRRLARALGCHELDLDCRANGNTNGHS